MPKTVSVFNGRPLGFRGPRIGIQDALGNRFDYAELMEDNELAPTSDEAAIFDPDKT